MNRISANDAATDGVLSNDSRFRHMSAHPRRAVLQLLLVCLMLTGCGTEGTPSAVVPGDTPVVGDTSREATEAERRDPQGLFETRRGSARRAVHSHSFELVALDDGDGLEIWRYGGSLHSPKKFMSRSSGEPERLARMSWKSATIADFDFLLDGKSLVAIVAANISPDRSIRESSIGESSIGESPEGDFPQGAPPGGSPGSSPSVNSPSNPRLETGWVVRRWDSSTGELAGESAALRGTGIALRPLRTGELAVLSLDGLVPVVVLLDSVSLMVKHEFSLSDQRGEFELLGGEVPESLVIATREGYAGLFGLGADVHWHAGEQCRLPGRALAVTRSPDGGRVAYFCEDERLRARDARDGKQVAVGVWEGDVLAGPIHEYPVRPRLYCTSDDTMDLADFRIPSPPGALTLAKLPLDRPEEPAKLDWRVGVAKAASDGSFPISVEILETKGKAGAVYQVSLARIGDLEVNSRLLRGGIAGRGTTSQAIALPASYDFRIDDSRGVSTRQSGHRLAPGTTIVLKLEWEDDLGERGERLESIKLP